MATCNLCPETPLDDEILDHIRVMHPEQWEEPQRWPDGGFVFTDQTDYTTADIADPCPEMCEHCNPEAIHRCQLGKGHERRDHSCEGMG
ncbi:hypothetical protein [Kineosporia babensis]|uniref:Uncharacterized protein n=1 Tax=Kineosporia babensis TaxID=499548 RepID=A0A9X1NBV2_9ACTN|nr:hypothetical protein [Kineosporia babensis]MCD5310815.1 hypothetical protein [Kineosporia babensis]